VYTAVDVPVPVPAFDILAALVECKVASAVHDSQEADARLVDPDGSESRPVQAALRERAALIRARGRPAPGP
jgi:hypothetical protein